MRIHNLGSFLLATSLFAACGDNLEPFPDDTSSILVQASCPGEPAQVAAARLQGTALLVTAQYGGCARSRVWACWDGQYGVGDPASTNVVVHFEPAGDCDAAFEDTTTIALDPMLEDRPVRIFAGAFDLVWRP